MSRLAALALLVLWAAPADSRAAAAPGSRAARGPNFVILLADDYGWGDPSPPLGAGIGQTPELNAMALAPGAAHFPRSYIGGSVCSPSRASILTGRSCTRDCVISVESMALPLQLQGNTIGDVALAAGYATMFAGKFHLGSMTNTTSTGCYPASRTNSSCLPGYVQLAPPANGTCCDGRDGLLPQRTPLDFGFRDVFATSQVAPSATSNCGCTESVPGAGVGCELGHYAGSGHYPEWLPALECMSTYETKPDGSWAPFDEVTDVDDAQQLVDRFERFVLQAVQADTPFLANIFFHQTHIPYVSPPEFRVPYENYTFNEQDYYGSAAAMDAQVGRVRRLLRDLGLAENTMVVFSADNGPEVDPASGQGTTTFSNPGSTGGLSGRKRAMLEGGIRVTGVIEAPWLVAKANGGRGGPLRLADFAQSHVDLLPTVLDLLNATRAHDAWPLDGVSLVPALSGSATERPNALGWMCAWPLTRDDAGADCPDGTQTPPSFPPGFSLPAGQLQVAWMEGESKLVGCKNAASSWYFRLFDVNADPGEADDLFESAQPQADAMFTRLQTWLASVNNSRVFESNCTGQHRV